VCIDDELQNGNNSGVSSLVVALIAIGALLVGLGIGVAIMFVCNRNRNNQESDQSDTSNYLSLVFYIFSCTIHWNSYYNLILAQYNRVPAGNQEFESTIDTSEREQPSISNVAAANYGQIQFDSMSGSGSNYTELSLNGSTRDGTYTALPL
jgi:hypothetical protein